MKNLRLPLKQALSLLALACFVFLSASIWNDSSSLTFRQFRLSATSLFWLRLFLGVFFTRFFLAGKNSFLSSPRFIWFLFAFFFVWMFVVKWTQHLAFYTHAHDLGLFHSALWNTVNGRFMVDSLRGQIFFSDHLIFFLVPLTSFYWIWPEPEALLFASALAFALGVTTIYRLSKERLEDGALAAILALAFGLNRYVWGAFLHEFHPDFFAPFFWFLLFIGFYRKKDALLLLALIAILSLKEDYSLYLIPVGVFFVLLGEKRRGVIISILAASYALLAFRVLLPFFYAATGKGASAYAYLGSWGYLGGSFGEITSRILSDPEVLCGNVVLKPLINFGLKFLFLPVLSPLTLIYLMPPLLLNASASFPLIRNLSIHYGLIPATLAFIASIESIRFLKLKAGNKFGSLSFCVAACLLLVGVGKYPFFFPAREASILKQTRAELALKGPLCAQSSLYPHLQPREGISLFPECSERDQYLLLHSSAEPYPLSREEFKESLREILRSGEWRILWRQGELIFFERAFR